jgi:hypothetical protein
MDFSLGGMYVDVHGTRIYLQAARNNNKSTVSRLTEVALRYLKYPKGKAPLANTPL